MPSLVEIPLAKILTYAHNNNNNNKKWCKNNKSPNFVWGLNKKQSKHKMSPETSFGGHNKKRSKHNKI